MKLEESLPEKYTIFLKILLMEPKKQTGEFYRILHKSSTWRGQQKNGPESVAMEIGITHGPNVRAGAEILSQACQVEGSFPGIPLVQHVLGVEDILMTIKSNRQHEFLCDVCSVKPSRSRVMSW